MCDISFDPCIGFQFWYHFLFLRLPDDMSDLSENEAKSDVSLEESEGEETGNEPYYEKVAKKAGRTLPEPPHEMSCQTEADPVLSEAEEKWKKMMARKKSLELPPISTEGSETDPKFTIRPTDVTVLEGEPLKLVCQVAGTDPVGEDFYISSCFP